MVLRLILHVNKKSLKYILLSDINSIVVSFKTSKYVSICLQSLKNRGIYLIIRKRRQGVLSIEFICASRVSAVTDALLYSWVNLHIFEQR